MRAAVVSGCRPVMFRTSGVVPQPIPASVAKPQAGHPDDAVYGFLDVFYDLAEVGKAAYAEVGHVSAVLCQTLL